MMKEPTGQSGIRSRQWTPGARLVVLYGYREKLQDTANRSLKMHANYATSTWETIAGKVY